MSKKEIYASIEIADHEIRLVVGEFYETRFNILRVEKAAITGIENKKIIDEQNIVNGIIKAARQAQEALGYRIERVLLALPSVAVKRHNRRVHVIPQESSKRIRLSDIQRALNEAISYKPDPQLELINVGCIKYITNGITSRKMPLDESSDILLMDVDLLYGDKEIVYSYARCIERAGLEILDVCLDAYAIAQEAAIFEQTVDKYVILVDIARQNTTLSLFTHGKLVNCELLDEGYEAWMTDLCENTGLNEHIGFRLMQNTCTFDKAKAQDTVIYIWSENGKQRQLTEKDVCDLVVDRIAAWVEMINEACAPIVANGDVHYLLSGEGCELQSITEVMDQLNSPWQIYVPQTVGARDSSLCACLGMFYSWQEQQKIRLDDRTSCSQKEIQTVVQSSGRKTRIEDEGGFTRRLKSMLLNDKEK